MKCNLVPKYVSTKSPWGIPWLFIPLKKGYTHRTCSFGSIKSKQKHSPNCKLRKFAKDSESIPRARKHSIDDIAFNGAENDIPVITQRLGTSVLDNIESFWMDA